MTGLFHLDGRGDWQTQATASSNYSWPDCTTTPRTTNDELQATTRSAIGAAQRQTAVTFRAAAMS